MHLTWYSWLIGFGLRLLFELPLVVWLLQTELQSMSRRLAIATFANLVTHPLVWFFFSQIPLAYEWPSQGKMSVRILISKRAGTVEPHGSAHMW